MASKIYKLGDKQFQSTGDLKQDIEIIKQNFPEVDTTALEQSLAGQTASFGEDMAGSKPELPLRITQLRDEASQFDPMTKDYKKRMEAYERERDDYLKLNPSPKEKAPSNSAEAAKITEIAVGGLKGIKDLSDEINNGNLLIGQALPYGIGDRKTDFLLNDLIDRLGRLRSGGAITTDEEKRFEGLLPGPLDFRKEDKLYKVNALKDAFQNIGTTMQGPQFQTVLEKIFHNQTIPAPEINPIDAEMQRRRKAKQMSQGVQ